jgi:polyribonucleotide nucleotidyltransferase
MTMHRVEMSLGRYTLSFETGRMAKQSDGAVVVRLGDTVVLATANAQRDVKPGTDFLPLTVDYRENTYAAGKIPGGFFKREGRPNEKEILTSRMIDRPLRPLFPEGYNNETQVIGLLLSADLENDSDTLAITGASTALLLSEIPFTEAVAAVRVGYWDGEFVVNPTSTELRTKSKLNLLIAGTAEAIVMVEAGAAEISEDEMVKALTTGHDAIKKIVAIQRELQSKAGKQKWTFTPKSFDPGFVSWAEQEMTGPLLQAMQVKGKIESYAAMKAVKTAFLARIPETEPEKRAMVGPVYEGLREKIARREILENHRHDGRRFDEVRTISSEVGVLPRTHGSALFTRGETQALVTVTLGTSEDMQIIDTVQEPDHKKRFMLHYNFPPFSVGEVKFLRGPGRREIGHGMLAERSLKAVMPHPTKFPYTVRVVSEILESNGSSSMASVCGGCLALMDAGVPIKQPVAGISVGLVQEDHGKFALLTDIQGDEDHYGDMDFKVAGTADGITALQMDIKVSGITAEIMTKALDQARRGRMHILEKMKEVLAAPRQSISMFAPRIVTIRIPVDKIRDVIGPGGKMIRSIIERTGVKIDVEDDGRVNVASADGDSAQKAISIIQELTATPELNKTYLGKIQRITDFGAFVEIMPGTDGLLHVSEIANHRVKDVRDELKEGEQVLVKVINIDPTGKIRLSRKALLQEQGGAAPAAPANK